VPVPPPGSGGRCSGLCHSMPFAPPSMFAGSTNKYSMVVSNSILGPLRSTDASIREGLDYWVSVSNLFSPHHWVFFLITDRAPAHHTMRSFILAPALLATAVLCAPAAPVTHGPYIGDATPAGKPWRGRSLTDTADGTRCSDTSPDGNPWHGEYSSQRPP